jgi:hypothetical protein
MAGLEIGWQTRTSANHDKTHSKLWSTRVNDFAKEA